MSLKQLQSRLEKLNAKIKTRTADLADLRSQAKGLKAQVAQAKAQAKTSGKSNKSK
jgi:chaperonin cofactor prefoldin